MWTRQTLAALALLVGGGCSHDDGPTRDRGAEPTSLSVDPAAIEAEVSPEEEVVINPQVAPDEGVNDSYASRRRALVNEVRAKGIRHPAVLDAIGRVERHRMVPEELRSAAYVDHALPIGFEQTISQPYVVALMTELADIQPGERVLEIGTGSGYQAAVLAELGAEVHSIEIVEPLARRTRTLLDEMGYQRVETRIGDGYQGWPEAAPFDAILITAAPPSIPEPLKEQLAIGGKLVVPVGQGWQELVVVTRTDSGFERRSSIPVVFVPMTGEAQKRR